MTATDGILENMTGPNLLPIGCTEIGQIDILEGHLCFWHHPSRCFHSLVVQLELFLVMLLDNQPLSCV